MEVIPSVAHNGLSPPDLSSSADPLAVLEHLSEVLRITLGAARRELEAVGCLLSKAKRADSVHRCARFASESQVAIYAQKDVVEEGPLKDSDANTGEPPSFGLDLFP